MTCNSRCMAAESTSADRTFLRNSPKLFSSFSCDCVSIMAYYLSRIISTLYNLRSSDDTKSYVSKSISVLIGLILWQLTTSAKQKSYHWCDQRNSDHRK